MLLKQKQRRFIEKILGNNVSTKLSFYIISRMLTNKKKAQKFISTHTGMIFTNNKVSRQTKYLQHKTNHDLVPISPVVSDQGLCYSSYRKEYVMPNCNICPVFTSHNFGHFIRYYSLCLP